MGQPPPRFSTVPWLDDAADLRPMGSPETLVEHGHEITYGLLVPHPWGPGSDAMIAIHAVIDGTLGGRVTLAITNEIRIVPTDVPVQRNPRRRWFTDDDDSQTPDDRYTD